MARTLYDVLGVGPSASPDELRQAYRDRAQVLHPDRRSAVERGETAVIAGPMQELNGAWRVLRDPAARAAYDRTLAASASPPAAYRQPTDDPADLDRPFRGRPAEPGDVVVALVRALPWVLVVLVLGGIFVFTAFAGGGGSPSSPALVGDCVRVSSELVEVVPCMGPEDELVVAVTTRAEDCPSAAVPTPSGRDRVLCLRPYALPGS